MAKAKYKALEDVRDSDKEYWVCSDGKNELGNVSLRYSRAVAKGRSHKGEVLISSSADPSQNKPSARVSRDKTKTLDRGIQLYRLWFNYLKLALELEELGVWMVVKNPTYVKNHTIGDIPKSVIDKSRYTIGGREGDSGIKQIFRCRQQQRVKVDRKKYEGWDLDEVLTSTFDKWWGTHSHLFEGFYPSIMTDKCEWVDDPNFVYVRIDKSSQWSDVQSFMKEHLSKAIKTRRKPRFKIDGLPRVNVLQNNFNALVLSVQGMSPKDICEHKSIYLRRTDEHFDAGRTSEDRLTVPRDRKTGQPKYSIIVSKQRVMGIHHLFEVCAGRFGSAPPTK